MFLNLKSHPQPLLTVNWVCKELKKKRCVIWNAIYFRPWKVLLQAINVNSTECELEQTCNFLNNVDLIKLAEVWLVKVWKKV